MRKVFFVFLLVVTGPMLWAQCYQDKEVEIDGASKEIYDRFCSGFWLKGTLNGLDATMYYEARKDEFYICGLSDETHNLCTHLYSVSIEHKPGEPQLIYSGEAITFTGIRSIIIKELDEYVEVRVLDAKDKLMYESKNFKWHSY